MHTFEEKQTFWRILETEFRLYNISPKNNSDTSVAHRN